MTTAEPLGLPWNDRATVADRDRIVEAINRDVVGVAECLLDLKWLFANDCDGYQGMAEESETRLCRILGMECDKEGGYHEL